jgi:hypothetical protein
LLSPPSPLPPPPSRLPSKPADVQSARCRDTAMSATRLTHPPAPSHHPHACSPNCRIIICPCGFTMHVRAPFIFRGGRVRTRIFV